MHPCVRAVDDVDVPPIIDVDIVGLDRASSGRFGIGQLSGLIHRRFERHGVVGDGRNVIRVSGGLISVGIGRFEIRDGSPFRYRKNYASALSLVR